MIVFIEHFPFFPTCQVLAALKKKKIFLINWNILIIDEIKMSKYKQSIKLHKISNLKVEKDGILRALF